MNALGINLLRASSMEALPGSPLTAVDLEEGARVARRCLHHAERSRSMPQLGGSPRMR